MNDNFVLDTAHTLAARLRKDVPGDARGQITKAWEILYGKKPADTDVVRSLAYLAEQTEAIRVYQSEHPTPAPAAPNTANTKPAVVAKSAAPETPAPTAPDPQLEALASLCQVLYSSNRFLYVE